MAASDSESPGGPPTGPSADFTEQVRALTRSGVGGEATSALFARLYDELRSLAEALMARERSGHTLTPTALVHEAFLRLVDQSRIEWLDRSHFFGFAARVMRQVLVDHARRRRAQKRGGEQERVSLTFAESITPVEAPDVLALDLALDALAREDERSARVAEMRLFAGLTVAEVAAVLGVSERTAQADWSFARRWLARELS